MRLKEFLLEDYAGNLNSDLNNLLVASKGTGTTEIRTSLLVNQLQQMGYSVNKNSILSALNDNPMIASATTDVIKLVEPEVSAYGDEDDAALRVKDMAQRASKKAQ